MVQKYNHRAATGNPGHEKADKKRLFGFYDRDHSDRPSFLYGATASAIDATPGKIFYLDGCTGQNTCPITAPLAEVVVLGNYITYTKVKNKLWWFVEITGWFRKYKKGLIQQRLLQF